MSTEFVVCGGKCSICVHCVYGMELVWLLYSIILNYPICYLYLCCVNSNLGGCEGRVAIRVV